MMKQMLLNIEYKNYGFFGAFGRKEWQRYFLGIIDGIINKFVSVNCKYIVYDVCEKEEIYRFKQSIDSE